jgi:hypothetical protein
MPSGKFPGVEIAWRFRQYSFNDGIFLLLARDFPDNHFGWSGITLMSLWREGIWYLSQRINNRSQFGSLISKLTFVRKVFTVASKNVDRGREGTYRHESSIWQDSSRLPQDRTSGSTSDTVPEWGWHTTSSSDLRTSLSTHNGSSTSESFK